ncbi:unnamed protein product, partial [Tuber aestivum]
NPTRRKNPDKPKQPRTQRNSWSLLQFVAKITYGSLLCAYGWTGSDSCRMVTVSRCGTLRCRTERESLPADPIRNTISFPRSWLNLIPWTDTSDILSEPVVPSFLSFMYLSPFGRSDRATEELFLIAGRESLLRELEL